MALNTINEILQDIKDGKMVIIMDDEDRENEGDLIMAAQCVRPEDINFMAKYGRGLVCLTLSSERCVQLNLPLMVSDSHDHHGTNFTLSIEAARGVTTGISAADRAATVQAAVAKDAVPGDIVQPGHVFPIRAKDGGVLVRAGHTEAGCDFARLAGLEPAAVIVEILNEDGSMARRPQLEEFAKLHDLKIGTIADLIEYRIMTEHTVERVAESRLNSAHGDFCVISYQDKYNDHLHFALVKGEINDEQPVLVRVHMQDHLADPLHMRMPDGGWPLDRALARINEEQRGIVVVLNTPYRKEFMIKRLKQAAAFRKQDNYPNKEVKSDLRTYGLGAQILSDLGVRRMRVLSAPKKVHALAGFGLEVVEYVECD